MGEGEKKEKKKEKVAIWYLVLKKIELLPYHYETCTLIHKEYQDLQ